MESMGIMDIQRYKNSNSQNHILANTFSDCSLNHENTFKTQSSPCWAKFFYRKKKYQKPEGKGQR